MNYSELSFMFFMASGILVVFMLGVACGYFIGKDQVIRKLERMRKLSPEDMALLE